MGDLRLILLCFVVVSWLFIHHAYSQNSNRELLLEDEIQAPHGGHMPKKENQVVLSNGIVNITLTTPGGDIVGISYKGSENLLSTKNKEDDRGYWDMNWTKQPNSRPYNTDQLQGTNYKILVQNEQQTEISFTRTWKAGSSEAPLSIDKRFVLLKGTPGFYTYIVVEHLKEWPAFTIQQARIVLKNHEKFSYMAMSDARQRVMPTAQDRATGQVLDFEEAVLLITPSNPDFKGEVDDKYYYTNDNKDIKVHGWVGDDIGLWMITPSNEFRTGGPFKQDLTSHVDSTLLKAGSLHPSAPTTLNMFTSTHYAGDDLAINIQSSEYWKMVWGPVFVYLNSNPSAKTNPSILWDDAKKRSQQETNSWPYAFPLSKDFLKSKERGTVKGQLLVFDRFEDRNAKPAPFAHVGLARPGDAGSWQYENKGYQFWTQTDNKGYFSIKNVIPGTYSLYASVPGVIGDYKHPTDIKITAGSVVDAKDVVFHAPRNGSTLWEIGIPDRTAAEFFIPDPSPRFKVHKYPQPVEKFREYGLWTRYTDFYPKEDLVFTIGKSDYKKDWFFAQVNRRVGRGFQPTTWKILFNLAKAETRGSYTLHLAIAGENNAAVQVRVNNPNSMPVFSTRRIGKENMLARHGIHGLYRWFSIPIPGKALINGPNTIFLTQPKVDGPFGGLMYDYIRLEGTPS